MRKKTVIPPITNRTEQGHLTPGYSYILNKPQFRVVPGESSFYNAKKSSMNDKTKKHGGLSPLTKPREAPLLPNRLGGIKQNSFKSVTNLKP